VRGETKGPGAAGSAAWVPVDPAARTWEGLRRRPSGETRGRWSRTRRKNRADRSPTLGLEGQCETTESGIGLPARRKSPHRTRGVKDPGREDSLPPRRTPAFIVGRFGEGGTEAVTMPGSLGYAGHVSKPWLLPGFSPDRGPADRSRVSPECTGRSGRASGASTQWGRASSPGEQDMDHAPGLLRIHTRN
jgi:hypothetical protein